MLMVNKKQSKEGLPSMAGIPRYIKLLSLVLISFFENNEGKPTTPYKHINYQCHPGKLPMFLN